MWITFTSTYSPGGQKPQLMCLGTLVDEWAGARKIDSDGIVALCAALRP
jgi:hypothetical protein